jgi:dihydrofolate reductase
MRKLTFGMNLSLDGYIAAPGDDLGWSVPSDELFQWWSDRVGTTGLALYGRKLWETMSSHWPTADQQPGATPAQIEFARRWRDMPKVVFSSTTSAVDWNTRLVTGDAVTEITRLRTEDGGPMDVGGATLAAAAMRAGLIDEYAIVTHPVLVGGGTPFFTALDNWVNLNLVETRTFSRRRAPDQVRDPALNTRRRIRRGLGPPKDPVAVRVRDRALSTFVSSWRWQTSWELATKELAESERQHSDGELSVACFQ